MQNIQWMDGRPMDDVQWFARSLEALPHVYISPMTTSNRLSFANTNALHVRSSFALASPHICIGSTDIMPLGLSFSLVTKSMSLTSHI